MKIFLLTVLATCVLFAKAYDPPPSYGGNNNDFEQKDDSVCFLPPIKGNCRARIENWHYDSSSTNCKKFIWGGCGGNGNRFVSEKLCLDFCRGPQNIRPFQPPGGGGNIPIRPNNYDDGRDAQIKPVVYPARVTKPFLLDGYKPVETLPLKVDDYKPPAVVQPIKVDDYKPAPVQPIKVDDYKPVDTFPIKVDDYKPERVDPDYKKPVKIDYQPAVVQPIKVDDYKPSGGGDRGFNTPVALPVRCALPLAKGNCKAYAQVWHYDTGAGSCKQFVYSGCQGNDNRFATEKECLDLCKVVKGAPNVYGGGGDKSHCRLPVAAGDCRAYARSWHYDPSVGACKSFVYTGCKGNMNRYSSEKSCLDDCKPNDYKVPPPREPVKSPVRPVRPPVRPPIKNDDYNRGDAKY